MQYTVHRGSQAVGGSCLEVRSQNARVLFDMGFPLFLEDQSRTRQDRETDPQSLLAAGILPNIDGLYQWDEPGFDAVVLSQAHLDHDSLLQWLHPDIPVWLSPGNRVLIDMAQRFKIYQPSPVELQLFPLGRPFAIKDMTIKPYLMGQSACDAAAFEVQADNQTLLYTGDFRGQGRQSRSLDAFVKQATKNANVLLIEGKIPLRTDESVRVEEELEQEFAALMMERGPFFFQCSSQNIDRVVTFYNACRNTKRIFVIDLYTANVLHELRKLGFSLPSPEVGSDVMHVFYPGQAAAQGMADIDDKYVSRFSRWQYTPAQIESEKERICMLVRPSMLPDLQKMTLLSFGQLVFSMYHGYRITPEQQQLEQLLQSRGTMIVPLHTSGHARARDLQSVIDGLQPQHIVSIHGPLPEKYRAMHENSRSAQDGIPVTI